ncbi:MAG: nicotinate phosphoribosyltransferase [Candidatus Obscuribacterales bacterium]|jgi:nicotinate phosphoribosyltransferase
MEKNSIAHQEAIAGAPSNLYQPSLATLTDLYQLTMAYGYFASGTMNKEAVFHMSFRKNPFAGGFAIAGGLESLVDFVQNFHFGKDDLEYLATLKGSDNLPLFSSEFLKYLSELKLTVDIDAVQEGEVVFAHEPLVRVKGPIIECQLLETALLNFINFQTLIATKAARLKLAAQGGSILEFGLRRAQGIDGGLSASRAAYLGGCDATSNVLAGRLYGIPVKGTHAHSWVMSYDSELAAFREYARIMPNNCIFLVDTYDTLQGVAHAIEAGLELRAHGHDLAGIRLDSGDLAYLSTEARKMLDAAGFLQAKIVASNDLDEFLIASLIDQGAAIDVWGVGTKLVTAGEQSALGGVYKLSCVRDRDKNEEKWQYRLKLSEQVIKISTPGIHQVRRYYLSGEPHSDGRPGDKRFIADMIFDCENQEIAENIDAPVIVDPIDFTRRKSIPPEAVFEDLLVSIFKGGKLVCSVPSLEQARALRRDRLQAFHPSILRLLNPHQYPVGLESGLHKMKLDIVMKERGFAEAKTIY